MTKRLVKRRGAGVGKTETQARNRPDPTIVLRPEARPVHGRPHLRYKFADGTYVDVDALYDEKRRGDQWRRLYAAEAPDAELGRMFKGRKPGSMSRLYREAVALLPGSAKVVLRKLETLGIVKWNEKNVKWKDDRGNPRTTSREEFEKQLSRYRARRRE